MCNQNWECCDKMLCSDHFGVGKCIPLTSTYPAPWPAPVPAAPVPWYGPYIFLKPKKKKRKKRKKKTKILIKVAGDLTGLTVKAKKKNNLFQSNKVKPSTHQRVEQKKITHLW